MDYQMLWVFFVGLVGGLLPSAYLTYKLRMLELDLAGFQVRFLSEQKRKAAKERWAMDDELKQLSLVPQPARPRRDPLAKFGVGGKSA